MRQQVRDNNPPTEYEIQLTEEDLARIVELVITRLNETQGSDDEQPRQHPIN